MPIIQRLNRQQQPSNSGSVSIARSSLDNILPMAQKRYNNALAVNGLPVLYYQQKNHGVRCSCSTNKLSTPNSSISDDVQVLPPQGFGSKEYVNSLLSGSVVRIDRYGSRKTLAEEVLADTVLNEDDARSKQFNNLFNNKSNENRGTFSNEVFNDTVEPMDTESLLSMDNNDLLGASLTETQGCGVCLGTGWVGGFNLINGLRLVYDTQYLGWESSTIIKNETLKPNVFSTSSRDVLIQILLPKNAFKLDSLRLFSNRKQITDVAFSLYDEETQDWLEINNPETLVQKCDGKFHTLKVTIGASTNIDVESITITHLETQFDIGSEVIYCEWNRMVETQNLQLPENLDPIQVILSPVVPVVHIFDIITEPYYDRAWKLTTGMDFYDRERNANGWEVQIRLIQKYELQSILPRRRLNHIQAIGTRSTTLPRLSSPDHSNLTYNPYNPNKSNKNR